MSTVRDFINLYRLYRRVHRPIYAAKRAYGIAVLGRPF